MGRVPERVMAGSIRNESFLVLFFKKEQEALFEKSAQKLSFGS
jgi:hypothetical protein